MFNKMTKVWLIGILLFLPFQIRVADNIELHSHLFSELLRYLDEVTIIVFTPLTIIDFFKNRNFRGWPFTMLLFFICLISISGFISGIVNNNSFPITILGTFDYTKNFLVIFIYAAFFGNMDEFKRTFRLLLIVAVSLGAIAFIQELWATISHYIVGKDIFDRSIYLLVNIPYENQQLNDLWRFGILRASSLLNHANSLGLYCVLILTLHFFIVKKINPAIFLSLFTGVFVSVSRITYTAFVLLSGLQILKGKKWLIVPAIFITILLLLTTATVKDWYFPPNSHLLMNAKNEEIHFRLYAGNKAMEIWKDHPLFGVGPGMFGGVVSIIYRSPVYEEYNFLQKWLEFMKPFRSLDQFWPQILAEMGILGTTAFAGLLITMFMVFFMLKKRVSADETRGLFAGLALATIFILIYSLGSGLNLTCFLYTYSALGGMTLSSYESSSYK